MAERQYRGGFHAALAALEAAEPPDEVLLIESRRDQRAARVREAARRRGVPLQRCTRDRLDLLLPGVKHQGVAVRVAVGAAVPDADSLLYTPPSPDALILALDGVQDPRNLGACMRSAEAAGAGAVLIPRDRAAQLSPAAHKASAGSSERLPLVSVTNLARALEQLRELGYWILGLEGESELSLWDAELAGPLVLVMGAEEGGMRRLTRERCDRLLSIPMAGATESLNVSVAAAVCLFEARRQRVARGAPAG
ncbi:23S rRNA (guanosine(2251)-2'-O)-methyltransferase RlmB [Algiphilus aromaticivorans]|jgi:23S rRNA (guanosine2251-2'-O)-methyltransferase|uniref:23S rRNA (guanosine(2251)-2'-O)-methyltransferase RlmB n=1 Tax=Algiphilus aromaticivorans TaxID=382454 RepID=UPI0005C14073|nr:23S rRNA (guanosine(2251)-2'-O)-methyltransferase RlmB [Algiphilus aromaticivorans]